MRCPGGEYMADPDADQTSQSAKDATKAAHDKRWVESRSDIGKNAVGTVPIIIISILLLVLSVAVVVALVQLWPLSSSSTSVHGTHYVVMWIHVNLELESNYFLIVVWRRTWWCHPFTALDCVLRGRKKVAMVLDPLLRMPTHRRKSYGDDLYLVLRGGLISSQASSQALSPYGMAAIAGLVGLFSDQAASMLKKIFSNLFTSANSDTPDSAPLN